MEDLKRGTDVGPAIPKTGTERDSSGHRFEVDRALKILIVKVSSLGDVIHALPVLYYLKSVQPSFTLDWIVEEPFSHVLTGHPFLRRLYLLRTRRWRKSPTAFSSLRDILELHRQIRRERYDVVLDLQGNTKSGVITLLTEAPLRVGFHASHVREWPNLLATNRKVRPSSTHHHIMDRNLFIAAEAFPGGSFPPTSGYLHVEERHRLEVDRFFERHRLPHHPTAVFHHATSWKTKLWDLDFWKRLVSDTVRDLGMNAILTWATEDERAACEKIREGTSQRVYLWPKSHLKTVSALLERAEVVVGGDTGLIHMAAAVGTPTVSLYLATDSRRNGPRGSLHRCLQSNMPCSPCLKKQCNRRIECSRSISVEEVWSAMRDVLDLKGSNRGASSHPSDVEYRKES